MLDAGDGAKATEWGGYHQSTLHTSPLLFDMDYDGVQDIMVATYDGDVVAFKDAVSICFCCLNLAQDECSHLCGLTGGDLGGQISYSAPEGQERVVCWTESRSH